MKKWLLVLLVLGPAAAANAVSREMLIYKYSERTREFTCDVNGIIDMNEINWIEWDKSVKTSTGYLIVQWNCGIEVNAWTVRTEKRRDIRSGGKMRKYALAEGPAQFSFAQAGVGEKTTWIVGSNSDVEHILLTGGEKPIKILGKRGDAATRLAGTRTWCYTDKDSIMHIGSSVISLRWRSKLTAEVLSDPYVLDGEDAVGWLFNYLANEGYLIP